MLNIGDKVSVILRTYRTIIEVEVTALHSGYYDDQYTGKSLCDGSTVYFTKSEHGVFYGRVA